MTAVVSMYRDALHFPSQATPVPSLELLQRMANIRQISVGEADRYSTSSGHNAMSDLSFRIHQDHSRSLLEIAILKL